MAVVTYNFTLFQGLATLVTLLHCLLYGAGAQENVPTVFDVVQFGAVGDEKNDDTQAFAKAWAALRQQHGPVEYLVPEGKRFLVGQSSFAGPCNASFVIFKVFGTIVSPVYEAWANVSDKTWWLAFDGMSTKFLLLGETPGLIDGQGSSWWRHNCKVSETQPCYTDAPTALTFRGSRLVKVKGLKIVNAAKVHVLLLGCAHFIFQSVKFSSPGDSTNNDGIHLSSSSHVIIDNAKIAAGDDCISIGSGSRDLNMTNIECGPGHGISLNPSPYNATRFYWLLSASIGSLGINGSEGTVEGVNVKNATFTGTTNGVRIKTWQGGFGHVKNVTFQKLQFYNVSNPIIIDQFYCDKIPKHCEEQKSAVQISGVRYVGAIGTSRTDVAINLNCSGSVPCTDLLLQDVNVTNVVPGKAVSAFCTNAQGAARGSIVPSVSCLS